MVNSGRSQSSRGGKSTPTIPNYYQWLGCDTFANVDVVKSAYRKLARQHHPDLNHDDSKAEERFKQINEAYATLGESTKRAQYDRALRIKLGGIRPQAKSSAPNHVKSKPKPQPSSSKAPFQGWVDGFFKVGAPPNTPGNQKTKAANAYSTSKTTSEKPPPPKTPTPNKTDKPSSPNAKASQAQTFKEASTKLPTSSLRGDDVTVETRITAAEAIQGSIKLVNVQHNDTCRRCSGTGKVMGTPCSQCHGDKTTQRMRKLEVRIPVGVKTGSRVRVAGEGGKGVNGGEDGDLFLLVVVDGGDKKRVKIEGLNAYSDLTLKLSQAILGHQTTIETLHGPISLTIPPGTQPETVLRMKQQGVHKGSIKGDHLVTVHIQIPKPDEIPSAVLEHFRNAPDQK